MIKTTVKSILAEIARTGKPVKIVAATKTRSADEINQLSGLGISTIGENRVQELLSKYGALKGCEIHFIGALQTNKVKYIVDKVSMIQSVDRLPLAEEIQKRCVAIGKTMDILIEVNIGGESQKSGCTEKELDELLTQISQLSNIRIKGLMTVLPINAERALYMRMREVFERAGQRFSGLEYLSMGMSDDYLTAIECGSNMVRLGTALFGARKQKQRQGEE